MGKKEKNAEGKVEVQTEMLVNCHINKIYKCIFFFFWQSQAETWKSPPPPRLAIVKKER